MVLALDRVEQATCTSYRAGHQGHPITVRRRHGEGEPGTVTGFDGDRVLLRTVGADVLQVGAQWFSCSTEPSPCAGVRL